MDLQRVLGPELYNRAKKFAEQKFGNRKLALLVRMAVEEYLERCGEMK